MRSKSTDEQLLAAFLGGENDAFGALAGRYETRLLGFARGMLDSTHLAQEAVQETWIRVARNAASFRQDSSLMTWMYRILVNECRRLQQREARAGLRTTGTHHLQCTDCDESDRIDRSYELRRALDLLDEPKRTTVLLCYHEGMTHEDVAGILDVPIGTVKSRLHAALESLRQSLCKEVSR